MLGRNISISDGLINDAMEIVNEFTWSALRRNQLEVGKYLHNLTANSLQADSKILIATFQYTTNYNIVLTTMVMEKLSEEYYP